MLLLSGIKGIMIISMPEDLPNCEKLLGTAARIGINLANKMQQSPRGPANAFILGEELKMTDYG